MGAASEKPPDRIRLEAWRWPTAFLAVFLVLVFAWGIGMPIRRLAEGRIGVLQIFSLMMGALAGASFLVLSIRSVLEFFLSIRVGIAVLVFFLLGSMASVLIHPRDPEKYLRAKSVEEAERLQADDFAWATGFFLYHAMHPYGIGLPKIDPPPKAMEGLARIASRYGPRIAKQEESGMRTVFSGNAKSFAIHKFIDENRDFFEGLYRACFFLQLNGTTTGKGAWSSDWFTALMGLLFLVVLTNTFRRGIARAIAQGPPGLGFVRALPSALKWDVRTLVSKERIGFLITHAGVLTALTGGLFSRLNEQRGIVQLSVNPERERFPQSSELFRTYSDQPRPFGSPEKPFRVELSRFNAEYRDNLDIEFLDDPAPKTVPRYRFFEVWKGHQIGLDYASGSEGVFAFPFAGGAEPRLIVRVLEHWRKADVEFELVERAPGANPASELETLGPAIKYSALGGDGEGMSGFLFAGRPGAALLRSFPKVRIRLEGARDAADQLAKAAAPFEGEDLGTLTVANAEGEPAPLGSLRVEPGAVLSFQTPKGTAKARVIRMLPDARLTATPAGEFVPRFAEQNPADLVPTLPGVELELTSPEGRVDKRWIFEGTAHDDLAELNDVGIGGTKVRFDLTTDAWRLPTRGRYRIVTAPGQKALLAKIGGAPPTPLEPGHPVKLDEGLTFRLDRQAQLPRIAPRITPVPGDPDSDELFFDASRPSAARIEVEGPEGKQEFVVATAPLADTAIYAGRVAIRLFKNEFELPREWKSKLEFFEQDGDRWVKKDEGTIRVNDYHTYGGYRFFQTDANRRFPGYSGVGVVRDPGIEVALAGMYLIVIGVATVFLIKPLLLRRKPS